MHAQKLKQVVQIFQSKTKSTKHRTKKRRKKSTQESTHQHQNDKSSNKPRGSSNFFHALSLKIFQEVLCLWQSPVRREGGGALVVERGSNYTINRDQDELCI